MLNSVVVTSMLIARAPFGIGRHPDVANWCGPVRRAELAPPVPQTQGAIVGFARFAERRGAASDNGYMANLRQAALRLLRGASIPEADDADTEAMATPAENAVALSVLALCALPFHAADPDTVTVAKIAQCRALAAAPACQALCRAVATGDMAGALVKLAVAEAVRALPHLFFVHVVIFFLSFFSPAHCNTHRLKRPSILTHT
jgi:predicted RNA polymerase sigma factor